MVSSKGHCGLLVPVCACNSLVRTRFEYVDGTSDIKNAGLTDDHAPENRVFSFLGVTPSTSSINSAALSFAKLWNNVSCGPPNWLIYDKVVSLASPNP